MKKIVLITSILTATSAFANDSTGYVGTGELSTLKIKILQCNVKTYSLVKN